SPKAPRRGRGPGRSPANVDGSRRCAWVPCLRWGRSVQRGRAAACGSLEERVSQGVFVVLARGLEVPRLARLALLADRTGLGDVSLAQERLGELALPLGSRRGEGRDSLARTSRKALDLALELLGHALRREAVQQLAALDHDEHRDARPDADPEQATHGLLPLALEHPRQRLPRAVGERRDLDR